MRKKFLKSYIIGLSVLSFVSCGSVPKNEIAKDSQATKTETVKLTAAENEFIKNLDTVNLTVKNSPKETVVNKAFTSPFSVKVLDSEDAPVADYAVKVTYLNNAAEKSFEIISTDADGICSFTPEVPVIGMNEEVIFEPYFESAKAPVVEAAASKSVSIPCKVKGHIAEKGTLLFVWDYNEKDRPLNNSYDILSEIRSRGIWMAGNAPVSETYYFDKPLSEVYSKNKEIVGNMYGFLITGQIKFTKPVEQVENEYLCSLIAEINVIDMSNGEVAFTNTFTNEALGSNWTKCVTKCKKELAGKIVDSIIYNTRL